MADKPKKYPFKLDKRLLGELGNQSLFNCRSSMSPLIGSFQATPTSDERKPWVQHPNACVVPSNETGAMKAVGADMMDFYYPSSSPGDQANLVAAVLSANYWLSEFCRQARELYPMGGTK